MKQQNPLIVQGDMTLLVEVHSPLYEEVRDHLARFAELLKSPEHIHTYKITPLSIWNASEAGYLAEEMIATLHNYAKEVRTPLPKHQRMEYAIADARSKFRIASENSDKIHVIKTLKVSSI